MQVIQEGTQYLYDFNKAFTKASLVMHTMKDLDSVTAKMKKNFEDLAAAVGESGVEVSKAFYRFGTLGIEQEKAWAGAQASIKQAVATYGDMDAIARSNALAISLLGNTLEKNLSIQEKMNLLSAKQVVLWKTNLMESNEFAGALERFLPTAKSLNLTLDQTIALLATLHSAGIRGTRAGRVLSTSMLKFIENLRRVGLELGIVIKEGDGTFSSLQRVLSAFSKMYQETHGKLSPELNKLFKEIFGGVRSQRTARSLAMMNELLKKNFDTINTMGGTATNKIHKLEEAMQSQLNTVTESYSKLIDINKQLQRQLGKETTKGFLKLLTGSTDERNAIKSVNWLLKTLLVIVKALQKAAPELNAVLVGMGATTFPMMLLGLIRMATALKKFWMWLKATEITLPVLSGLVHIAFPELLALAGALAGIQLASNLVLSSMARQITRTKELANSYNKAADAVKRMADALKSVKTAGDLKTLRKSIHNVLAEIRNLTAKKMTPQIEGRVMELYKTVFQYEKRLKELENHFKTHRYVGTPPSISGKIRDQLKLLEKSQKYIDMQTAGFSDIEIAQQKLNDYIDVEVGEWNKIVANAKKLKQEGYQTLHYVSRQEIETALLAGNYNKIKNALNYQAKDEKKIVEMKKLQLAVIKAQEKAVASYSNTLKSTFQKDLSSVLQGKIDLHKFFTDFQTKLSSSYSEAVTKNITNSLEKSTGIFRMLGGMLAGVELKGTMGEPIVKASDIGAKKFYNAIVSASATGSKMVAGKPIGIGVGGGMFPSIGGVSGIMGGGRGAFLPSWFPFNARLNRFFGATSTMGATSFIGGGGGFFPTALTGLVTGALTGDWRTAAFGTIAAGLTAVNPILGLGFSLLSSLFGHHHKTITTTSWKNPQIAKNLMPFLGISPAPMPTNTYALPTSYYFVSNVTVHVDKIQGERPDIVNEIANNVKTTIQEQTAQNYYHNLLRAVRPKSVGF